ncbi:MAG: M48 family metallopeptidase [Candidatus Acidiferrales bacterium]
MAAVGLVFLVLPCRSQNAPEHVTGTKTAYGFCSDAMDWKVLVSSSLETSAQVTSVPCETEFVILGAAVRWRVPVRTKDGKLTGYVVETMLQDTPSSRHVGPGPHGAPTTSEVSSLQELDRLHAVIFQLTIHPCQNIGAAATIVESDPEQVAHLLQSQGARQIMDSGVTLDEYLRVALVLDCLTHGQRQYQLPRFQWNIQKSDVINASAIPSQNMIVVTTGIIEFTRDDPGELAFAVAHEIGHLVDQPSGCAAAIQREQIIAFTEEGAQRACERRADSIGFQYLVGAGLNPYEAAAYFGRMQMFSGNPGLFAQFLSDHPIDAERIQNLRNLLIALLQNH